MQCSHVCATLWNLWLRWGETSPQCKYSEEWRTHIWGLYMSFILECSQRLPLFCGSLLKCEGCTHKLHTCFLHFRKTAPLLRGEGRLMCQSVLWPSRGGCCWAGQCQISLVHHSPVACYPVLTTPTTHLMKLTPNEVNTQRQKASCTLSLQVSESLIWGGLKVAYCKFSNTWN